jgi:hypothetical protein
MTDPVIRPGNGLLLIVLQSAEGTPGVPSAATDVILIETDSVDYNDPYKTEATSEATGSFDAGPPLVLGQPATFNFRARLRGAGVGVTYTASVKPPLHAALSACGFLGVFTASVSAAALTAGTVSSGTLGTGFGTTAQMYRGMPLVMSGAPAAGRRPLVTDFTAAKVASLSDLYGSALSATNQAALPANWTYAPTTPGDGASRATMHPCATIYWYEDGTLRQLTDCRGVLDLEGNSARPGFGNFSFTGIYGGISDAAVPASPVFTQPSAPLLVQGTGVGPVAQVNRRGLPISKWSIKSNSQVISSEDPNSPIGYGSGQIADRMYVLEVDPLKTLVATRNAIADIGAFSQYPASLQFGTVIGNSVSILMPLVQPTDSAPTMRDKLRAETLHYQAIGTGRDNASRDGSIILCFS